MYVCGILSAVGGKEMKEQRTDAEDGAVHMWSVLVCVFSSHDVHDGEIVEEDISCLLRCCGSCCKI